MMLTIDTIAMLAIFVIAILHLNEQKHGLFRTLLWAMVAAGTFGLCCEQLARGRVFGPDVWAVMTHVGVAGLLAMRYCKRYDMVERRTHDFC